MTLKTEAAPMIEAVGLSKFYGTFAAIRDVSFAVRRGQVAAFLGPNGAGKSTTLRILTGYLTPSAGVARIAGMDVAGNRIEAAALVGYLPENGPLYPEMTPRELLRFFGEARGLSDGRLRDRIDAVVDQCNLDAVIEKSIYKLSKGYRQRVGMAHVLLHEPDILIMDEPTSGLDPNQIREVRELIRQLGETKTILISTHILQEVKAVADHVILVHDGRIVFNGTADEMAAGESLEDAFYRLTGKGAETAAAESGQPPPAQSAVAASVAAGDPEPPAEGASDSAPRAASTESPPAPESGSTAGGTSRDDVELPVEAGPADSAAGFAATSEPEAAAQAETTNPRDTEKTTGEDAQ